MFASLPTPRRLTAAVVALGWTAASFGIALAPGTAEARDNAPYYRAELATPATQQTTIADGVLWYCQGDSCAARKDRSKPWITCKRLAQEVGQVTRFTYGGEALSADKLAQCNAR